MTERKKKALFTLLTISLVIIAILSFTEIMFRITRKIEYIDDTTTIFHPIFHHFHKPNSKGQEQNDGGGIFFINSQGLRGKEFSIEKPKGVFRIAILGDSFTFGYGVNDGETFFDFLEGILNSKITGQKYEVINCGICSYSPMLEYLLLKYKIINYSPNLVMLFF